MTIEEKLDRILATLDTHGALIMDAIAESKATREAVRPKLLNRRALAELLNLQPAALRNHLYPRKGQLSRLGETLQRLAMVGPDGKQWWRPSDIAAHCRPWLGRDAEALDETSA